MNTHPYLRAYMAGIFTPSLVLLVILSGFILTRLVLQVPIPIERVIVFPMALVPNLFGLWNILYVWSHRRLPIGFHGALLPWILAPARRFAEPDAPRHARCGYRGGVRHSLLSRPPQLAVDFPGGVPLGEVVSLIVGTLSARQS